MCLVYIVSPWTPSSFAYGTRFMTEKCCLGLYKNFNSSSPMFNTFYLISQNVLKPNVNNKGHNHLHLIWWKHIFRTIEYADRDNHHWIYFLSFVVNYFNTILWIHLQRTKGTFRACTRTCLFLLDRLLPSFDARAIFIFQYSPDIWQIKLYRICDPRRVRNMSVFWQYFPGPISGVRGCASQIIAPTALWDDSWTQKIMLK